MRFFCVVIYKYTSTGNVDTITRKYYKNLSNALEYAKYVVNEYNSRRCPSGVYFYNEVNITEESFLHKSKNSMGTKYCEVAQLLKNGKTSCRKEWIDIELIDIEDEIGV